MLNENEVRRFDFSLEELIGLLELSEKELGESHPTRIDQVLESGAIGVAEHHNLGEFIKETRKISEHLSNHLQEFTRESFEIHKTSERLWTLINIHNVVIFDLHDYDKLYADGTHEIEDLVALIWRHRVVLQQILRALAPSKFEEAKFDARRADPDQRKKSSNPAIAKGVPNENNPSESQRLENAERQLTEIEMKIERFLEAEKESAAALRSLVDSEIYRRSSVGTELRRMGVALRSEFREISVTSYYSPRPIPREPEASETRNSERKSHSKRKD